MSEPMRVGNVLIGRGDGDTDPECVYIQQDIVLDWVSFPVTAIPAVIAALESIAATTEEATNG